MMAQASVMFRVEKMALIISGFPCRMWPDLATDLPTFALRRPPRFHSAVWRPFPRACPLRRPPWKRPYKQKKYHIIVGVSILGSSRLKPIG